MSRFFIALAAVALLISTVLYVGASPERRYETADCQFRMIYDYEPELEMGLVTLGGSRVRVSTSARHFNTLIEDLHPGAVPVHNLSHSYYTLEKEYVLTRDLLEQHSVKTILIMVEPRWNDFGKADPDFLEIARLSDIPLTVKALWPENPLNAVRAGHKILIQHLGIFDRVDDPHRETTDRDCDRLDYRLDIPALERADDAYAKASQSVLDWDVTRDDHAGFLRWMMAFRSLQEQTGTQVMFLLMTATSEPLPPKTFADQFLETTGMELIVLDTEIQAVLAEGGRRDASHLNAAGRAVFIPWLVPEVEAKCQRPDGCF
ncbi:MAG: hypothetical protein AB8B62_10055 [Roseobacter sp.]